MTSSEIGVTPGWVTLSAAVVRRLPMGRYRAMDRLCRMKGTPAFLARMPEELGGSQFVCDLRDSISREVCFTGRYEAQETAILRSVLRPGMIFLDVGANWGYFTLIAAHSVGAAGRVLSLEPDPRLFKRLTECLVSNSLTQVTALPVAAGAEAATLSLSGYDEKSDNFGLSRIAGAGAAEGVEFSITARAIDDILDDAGIHDVDLLKMDIEGYEGFALAGMKNSLAAHRIKRIILELHPEQLAEHGQTGSALVERLKAGGYRAHRIDHSPAAFRRAAYQRDPDPRGFLTPLTPGTALDAWPHMYLTAPGVEL
jgi:FkbM family methyltransferase